MRGLLRDYFVILLYYFRLYFRFVYGDDINGTTTQRRRGTSVEPESTTASTSHTLEPVHPQDLTFQASLEFKKSEQIYINFCDASIINDYHLITAAECKGILNQFTSDLSRSFAVCNELHDPASSRNRIVRFISHPNYSYITHDHDIAIIKIEGRLKWNQFVRPISFQVRRTNLYHNCFTTSWLRINEVSNVDLSKSKHLYKIDSLVIDPIICKFKKNYRNFHSDRMMCVVNWITVDICNVTNGSPLTCDKVLSGVSRSPHVCGPTPDVYTKIDYYALWIDHIVNGKDVDIELYRFNLYVFYYILIIKFNILHEW